MSKVTRSVLVPSLMALGASGLFLAWSGPAGAASSCASNSTVKVTGGTISFTSQVTGLKSLGVSVSKVSPAKSGSNGAVQFPISGGSVNNSSASGSINTNGGLKFTDTDGRSVSLTNFSVNTRNGLVTASANGTSVQLLKVNLSTASTSSSKNQVNVSGLVSTLASAGAVALNHDLAITKFTPSYRLGTFTGGIKYSC